MFGFAGSFLPGGRPSRAQPRGGVGGLLPREEGHTLGWDGKGIRDSEQPTGMVKCLKFANSPHQEKWNRSTLTIICFLNKFLKY